MAPGLVPEGERLNLYLARRGVASRRGADRLAAAGRVRVNGEAALPGRRLDPLSDVVTVDGRVVPPAVPRRTLMVNKPVGVVSTRHDPARRATVLDLVDDPDGLAPVGRLDADSRGLLLLTSDGALAFRLTHPRFGVPKVYRVTLDAPVGERVVRGLLAGVELSDGPARALDAAIVERRRGADVLLVTMGEGRRREVRRMCAAAGAVVTDLERVGLGPLRLGRLRAGTARRLSVPEERDLYAAVRLEAPVSRRRPGPV